jgi:hypothetical protein
METQVYAKTVKSGSRTGTLGLQCLNMAKPYALGPQLSIGDVGGSVGQAWIADRSPLPYLIMC